MDSDFRSSSYEDADFPKIPEEINKALIADKVGGKSGKKEGKASRLLPEGVKFQELAFTFKKNEELTRFNRNAYVPLLISNKGNSEQEMVMVKVSSVAARLQINEKEVRNASENDFLEQLIEEKAGKLQRQFSDQKAIKDSFQSEGFSSKKAEKIISQTLKAQKKGLDTFQDKGVTYFIFSTEDHPLELARCDFRADPLAEGGMGKVHEAWNMTAKARSVIKLPKENELAKRDVINEFKVLSDIHRDGLKPGIQAPPNRTISIDKKEGYLAAAYDSTLEDIIREHGELSREEAVKCCQDLFQGLHIVHELGYYHGDIKPPNLAKHGGDYLIADFGGALHLENQDIAINQLLSGHTAKYTPQHVIAEIKPLTTAIVVTHLTEGRVDDPAKYAAILRDEIGSNGSLTDDEVLLLARGVERLCVQAFEQIPGFKEAWIDNPNAAPLVHRSLLFMNESNKAIIAKLASPNEPSGEAEIDFSSLVKLSGKEIASRVKEMQIGHDAFALGLSLIETISGQIVDGEMPVHKINPHIAEILESKIGKNGAEILIEMISENQEVRIAALRKGFNHFIPK